LIFSIVVKNSANAGNTMPRMKMATATSMRDEPR
jgi:hypothetical protein